jgi:hypothetical protein
LSSLQELLQLGINGQPEYVTKSEEFQKLLELLLGELIEQISLLQELKLTGKEKRSEWNLSTERLFFIVIQAQY